jgi:hypothetical protein
MVPRLGLFAVTVYTAVQTAVNTAPVTVPYRRFQQQLTARQVPGRHTVQTRTVRERLPDERVLSG